MFLFDKEYLMERIVLPAGVARYVAEFFTQFFNYVNVGAAIIAVFFVALQQGVWQLAKKHCKDKAWYWISFLPVLMLWFSMGNPNSKQTFLVSLLFALLAMLCYPARGSKNMKAIYLLILDTETNELVLSPSVKRVDSWETYPAFSADGKTIYFCAAQPKQYSAEFKEVKYVLCKASFDSKTGMIGEQIDTLINNGKSVVFPRPSYDGKWLMYTQADYGCFPMRYDVDYVRVYQKSE